MRNLISFCRNLFYNLKQNPQRFLSALLIFVLCLVCSTNLRAEITWGTPDTVFAYRVTNKSYFFYAPNQYDKDYNQYINIDDYPTDYGSSAEIDPSEYFTDMPPPTPPPGSAVVQMLAKAMGPEGGIDPPDGLMARAFSNTVASDLSDKLQQAWGRTKLTC
ncbi:MAG: hypothetical protein GY850_04530 [bacterium]|nr:hypothetical protein [bacterium]